MLFPIPMMLQLLDILPIRRNIGSLVLCVDVLISVQWCKLLLLQGGQVGVMDSYFRVLLFLCMVVIKQHGRHYGSSMFQGVLIGM